MRFGVALQVLLSIRGEPEMHHLYVYIYIIDTENNSLSAGLPPHNRTYIKRTHKCAIVSLLEIHLRWSEND